MLARPTRRGHRAAGRDRASPTGAARGAAAAAGSRRAPPPQGRLRALADRAAAGDRAGAALRAERPDGAAGRAAARHRQAGDPALEPGGGVRSTTTRWSARSWPRRRLTALSSRRRDRATCPGWSSCTCGSTATAGRVDGLGGAPVRPGRRAIADHAQRGSHSSQHPPVPRLVTSTWPRPARPPCSRRACRPVAHSNSISATASRPQPRIPEHEEKRVTSHG